jgi:ferredoxin
MRQGMAVVSHSISITLRGEISTVEGEPGETIVQAAFRAGIVPPISCLSGHCGTCMARMTEGRVEMLANDVLTPEEIGQGYVLTCQAVPVTRTVAVVYED